MRFHAKGKMSTFGGPKDTGMAANEGLALVSAANVPALQAFFLPAQPPGTTGLGRRLDPSSHYIACRWDYSVTSKAALLSLKATVTNPANGKSADAQPVDWGPNAATGRVADLSPGLATFLGVDTGDEVEVSIP